MIVALLLGCSDAVFPTTTLQIGAHTLTAEVADDGEERALGLMYRDTLGQDDGMLFVYPDRAPRSFWMKNTRIPLSVAFLDDDGTILEISDLKPMDDRSVSSVAAARYALEVNQGWFGKKGVVVGEKVLGLPQ